jgi:L-fuconolactonase
MNSSDTSLKQSSEHLLKQKSFLGARRDCAVNRRTFLSIAATLATRTLDARPASMPIIDTHIHLFDTTRPQGVPWPEKKDVVLYKPALPDRFRKIAVPAGVVGAIVVEASPWLADNQWILDLAARNTMIVGTVGNLEPGQPDFQEHLEKFHRNPLFVGIRYGNLWGRNLGQELSKPEFISGLRLLASAGLELDTYIPDPALISDLVRLTDKVPNLRVVIDHLPELDPPPELRSRKAYQASLQKLGERPQVYVKLSALLRRVDGRVPQDLNFYRARLDELWTIFGEDRLLYGSDWPNSDLTAPYEQLLNVVRQYFVAKGQTIAEKFFWRNSAAAYRFVKRDPSQPDRSAPDRAESRLPFNHYIPEP